MNSPWAVMIDENVGWLRLDKSKAPEAKWVLTKQDDAKGARNIQLLKHVDGLWWSQCGMYVHYVPTHWKPA